MSTTDQTKQTLKHKLVQIIANIITTNLLGLADKKKQDLSSLLKPSDLLELAKLFYQEQISNQGLQEAIEYLAEHPESSAKQAVQKLNLLQINDPQALQTIVEQCLQANPGQIEQYLAGKTQILGFLVGYCMKLSQGKGNPKLFNKMLSEELAKLKKDQPS